MGLLKHTWIVYQEEGISEVLKRTRFQFFKCDQHYVYELSLENNSRPLPTNLIKITDRLKKQFEVKWLAKESIEDFQPYLRYCQNISEEEVTIPEEDVMRWLNCGYAVVTAWYREKIIGDVWFALDSFPFPNPDIAIADMMQRDAYSFLAHVDPQYRGLGVFPLLLGEQVEAARRKSKRALFATVRPNNKDSKRSLEKMGFKRIGTLYVWWVIGKKYSKLMKVR